MGKSITDLSSVTAVGLDLAKHVFQVHAVDASGRVVVAKAIRRNKLLEFFASLPAHQLLARGDDRSRGDRRRHQAHDDGVGSLPKAHGNSRRRPTDRPRLCRRHRRSLAHPPITRRRRLSGPGRLGLVPKRYQSGVVDYIGGISKCGDRRVRTLLYEAANVMLTRYKGQLKLKDWAFAIARRSTMRKARVALARRLAIIMHAMLRDGTEFLAA